MQTIRMDIIENMLTVAWTLKFHFALAAIVLFLLTRGEKT